MKHFYSLIPVMLSQAKRYWLLILSVALLIVVWHIWPNTPKATPVNAPQKISTVTASPVIFERAIDLSGSLIAREDIAVGTALQDQRVAALYAEVGDTVKKGQLLATLESRHANAQLQESQAALSRAHAVLEQQNAVNTEAQITLKRIEALASTGAVSAQEVDEQRARARSAAANLRAAQADIIQSQAQLDNSHNDRNNTQILAPADGTIITRTARVGTLAGTEPLFRLMQQGVLELNAEVFADDLPQLSRGMPAQVYINNSVEPIPGQIRYITPEVNTRTRLGNVRITLNTADHLPIGSYAQARVFLPPQHIDVALPVRAVAITANGDAYIMQVADNGLVSRRAVTIGARYHGMLAIRSGLHSGERVVLNATAFVNDGDVITIDEAPHEGHAK